MPRSGTALQKQQQQPPPNKQKNPKNQKTQGVKAYTTGDNIPELLFILKTVFPNWLLTFFFKVLSSIILQT